MLKRCDYCGKRYETSKNKNNAVLSRFCSPNHRNRFWLEKEEIDALFKEEGI